MVLSVAEMKTIVYRISEQDYVRARVLLAFTRTGTWYLLFIGTIITAGTVFCLIYRGADATPPMGALFSALFVAVLVSFNPVSRRIYRKNRQFHGEFTLGYDDGGVEIASAHVQVRMPYPDMVAVWENAKVGVIQMNSVVGEVVPKSTPDLVAAFAVITRNFKAAKVVTAKTGKS